MPHSSFYVAKTGLLVLKIHINLCKYTKKPLFRHKSFVTKHPPPLAPNLYGHAITPFCQLKIHGKFFNHSVRPKFLCNAFYKLVRRFSIIGVETTYMTIFEMHFSWQLSGQWTVYTRFKKSEFFIQ